MGYSRGSLALLSSVGSPPPPSSARERKSKSERKRDTRIYVFIYTYLSIHIHLYLFIFTFLYIYIYIYIYIYTYTVCERESETERKRGKGGGGSTCSTDWVSIHGDTACIQGHSLYSGTQPVFRVVQPTVQGCLAHKTYHPLGPYSRPVPMVLGRS